MYTSTNSCKQIIYIMIEKGLSRVSCGTSAYSLHSGTLAQASTLEFGATAASPTPFPSWCLTLPSGSPHPLLVDRHQRDNNTVAASCGTCARPCCGAPPHQPGPFKTPPTRPYVSTINGAISSFHFAAKQVLPCFNWVRLG